MVDVSGGGGVVVVIVITGAMVVVVVGSRRWWWWWSWVVVMGDGERQGGEQGLRENLNCFDYKSALWYILIPFSRSALSNRSDLYSLPALDIHPMTCALC